MIGFKQFFEIFDSNVEIDWGQSSGNVWLGFFWVPVKQSGLKVYQGDDDTVQATQVIKYKIEADISKLNRGSSLWYMISPSPNAQNLMNNAKTLMQISFARWSDVRKQWTFETPGPGEDKAEDNTVWGTVIKGIKEVIERASGIDIIIYSAYADKSADIAQQRAILYRTMANVIGPKNGFYPITTTDKGATTPPLVMARKELLVQQEKLATATKPQRQIKAKQPEPEEDFDLGDFLPFTANA
jgi:hypothetical protein